VTSDLAINKKKADHGQGASGKNITREKATKFFASKILTSKPLGLKILQSIFAEPAPVKAFRGWGEGGYPLNPRFSRNETRSNVGDFIRADGWRD
jgi:hypothetical protein